MSRFVHFSWKFCLSTFLLAALLACKTYYTPVENTGILATLDSTIVSDPSALSIIEPYKKAIDIEMNEIICFSEVAITKNQPEGLLNNFVSDLVLYMVNTYYNENEPYDVAIFNNGGLRAALPKGLIKVEDVYKLMPFENEVVVLTLTPEAFLSMISYIINSGGVPFAGMRIVSKQLQLESLTINSIPFDENRNYTVVTSDYLASGGDKMGFFQNPVESKHFPVLIRDLIIEYLREQNAAGNSLDPKLDGRIVYE